jgi:glycolate oxidase
VDSFFGKIYQRAVQLGGEISGEHGIGFGKIKYFAEAAGEVNIGLMRGIKGVFDPKGILNPGKIICRL